MKKGPGKRGSAYKRGGMNSGAKAKLDTRNADVANKHCKHCCKR